MIYLQTDNEVFVSDDFLLCYSDQNQNFITQELAKTRYDTDAQQTNLSSNKSIAITQIVPGTLSDYITINSPVQISTLKFQQNKQINAIDIVKQLLLYLNFSMTFRFYNNTYLGSRRTTYTRKFQSNTFQGATH